MRKTLYLLTLLLAAPLLASGQCALNHTIELYGGPALGSYSWSGESTSARGFTNGGDGGLRYTCYFNDMWGAFLSISSFGTDAFEPEFFGVVNKADGGRYLYRFNSGNSYSQYFPGSYTAGVACRLGAGRFGFVPRLGAGIGIMSSEYFGFERRSRDGSTGPEYFNCRIANHPESCDYLIDDTVTYSDWSCFMVTAGLQVTYRPDRLLYVFVEPGLNWAPGKVDVKHEHTGSVRKYEPINWVEAVAYADATDIWTKDTGSTTSMEERWNCAPVFTFNFGIGINLGNRR